MEQVREIHPGMGLRTMYEMLQPEGIGRDGFIALGLQEGFRLQTTEPQVRTTFSIKSSRYRNLLGDKVFTDINQVWSSDITYFHSLGRFYYIVFIMDVYSRRIIGHHVSDNLRADNNLAALKAALRTRGIHHYGGKLVHHSDKGSQYASDPYTELLEQRGIKISMCNEVYENTHIERVNETIKNQYLKRKEIRNFAQLVRQLDASVTAYNESKPHQALSGLSPVQFEELLPDIEIGKRKKLVIYTIQQNVKMSNRNQLNLFNS
jgi:putative transposase